MDTTLQAACATLFFWKCEEAYTCQSPGPTKEETVKITKLAIVALVFLSVGFGVSSLAKPPGGGGGGGGTTQNCNRVVCAQCPEGYVLLKGIWPDCCACVPAP
jgi:hypothetical protein